MTGHQTEPWQWVDPRWEQRPGPIIDIGCLDWTWSRQFLGRRQVVGFDPFEEGLAPGGAILHNEAVSVADGTIWVSGGDKGCQTIMALNQGPGMMVHCLALQSVLKMYPDPAIVKMNIEGAEYPLLMSVRHPIADQLIVSFHDRDWLPSSIYDFTATNVMLRYLEQWYTQTCIYPACKWWLLRRRYQTATT